MSAGNAPNVLTALNVLIVWNVKNAAVKKVRENVSNATAVTTTSVVLTVLNATCLKTVLIVAFAMSVKTYQAKST